MLTIGLVYFFTFFFRLCFSVVAHLLVFFCVRRRRSDQVTKDSREQIQVFNERKRSVRSAQRMKLAQKCPSTEILHKHGRAMIDRLQHDVSLETMFTPGARGSARLGHSTVPDINVGLHCKSGTLPAHTEMGAVKKQGVSRTAC